MRQEVDAMVGFSEEIGDPPSEQFYCPVYALVCRIEKREVRRQW